jgi:hypothetical protein
MVSTRLVISALNSLTCTRDPGRLLRGSRRPLPGHQRGSPRSAHPAHKVGAHSRHVRGSGHASTPAARRGHGAHNPAPRGADPPQARRAVPALGAGRSSPHSRPPMPPPSWQPCLTLRSRILRPCVGLTRQHVLKHVRTIGIQPRRADALTESTHPGWIRMANALVPPPRGPRRVRGQEPRGASLVLPPSPQGTLCLHTEHVSRIWDDTSWHVPAFPAVRGGSYGASRGHLRTAGSQRHGALPRERGAPGDLARFTRG